MGEVVNLRQARKRRTRDIAEQAAAEARAKHGLTKAQRNAERSERQRAARRLDDHQLVKADDGDTSTRP